MEECQVCFSEADKLYSFGCGHDMCSSCVQQYIETSVLQQRKSFLLLKCPKMGCDRLCSHEDFKKLANAKTLQYYNDVLLKTIPENPTSIESFNYHYNNKGQLRCKLNDAPFHFISQYHYDAIGEFIVRHIQELMMKECDLQEVWLPQDSKLLPLAQPVTAQLMQALPLNNIFMSKDALTNPDKLMLLIQGSGAVRAGMWARALCINDSLETGTQINYIKQAQKEGYGVIVFNPNLNRVPKKMDPLAFTTKGFFTPEKPKPVSRADTVEIDKNASPPEHTIYVYDQFVKKAQAKHIVIVAHSAGGWCTIELLKARGQELYKKLRGIAFTDSVHSVLPSDPKHVQQFISQNAVNWVTSDQPLDTRIKMSTVGGCLCVSAGHTKHENTSESCRTSAFKHLDNKVKEAEQ